jgi:hypothetical protein
MSIFKQMSYIAVCSKARMSTVLFTSVISSFHHECNVLQHVASLTPAYDVSLTVSLPSTHSEGSLFCLFSLYSEVWKNFWSNSCNSKTMFTLQKKIVTIIAGDKPTDSCRSLCKGSEIITLPCEYILSSLLFVVSNEEHFQTNFAIHNANTRKNNQLHRPIANLPCFQKSAYYAIIQIFNSLKSSLTSIINKEQQFKVALKTYLITHTFYSVD